MNRHHEPGDASNVLGLLRLMREIARCRIDPTHHLHGREPNWPQNAKRCRLALAEAGIAATGPDAAAAE